MKEAGTQPKKVWKRKKKNHKIKTNKPMNEIKKEIRQSEEKVKK
jgi:hypothetical protein